MLRLTTFGGFSVRTLPANVVVLERRRSLAVLVLLAMAAPEPVSRDKILADLWPELDTERCRNALNQTLFAIRRDLGPVILGKTDLRLDLETIATDIRDFDAAIDTGDYARAVAMYTGPFGDGFHLSDAPAFERRVDETRVQCARRAAAALESLAAVAERKGDLRAAVEHRRGAAELDPLSSHAVLSLVRVLAASGDRLGALSAARRHEKLLRDELDAGVDPAMAAFIQSLLDEGRSLPRRSGVAAAGPAVETASPGPLENAPRRIPMLRRRSVRLAAAGVAAVVLGATMIALRQTRADPAVYGTRSLPAVRWYLSAQTARRDGRYAIALDGYQRAVREDSTFALAYYGMSNAADWASRADLVLLAARQAVRFSAPLAEHDRLLLEAHLAWRENRTEDAERGYERLLHAYPQDAEAWFQFGELLFHNNSRRGRSFTESRQSFDRVRVLQPDEHEALLHLVRIALYAGTRRDVDSLTALALRIVKPSDAVELRALRAFALDDSAAQRAALRELAGADGVALGVVAWRLSVFLGQLDAAEQVLRLGQVGDQPTDLQVGSRGALMRVLGARGRFRAAREQSVALERIGPLAAYDGMVALADMLLSPDRVVPAGDLRAFAARLDSASGALLAATPPDSVHAALEICYRGLIAGQLGDVAGLRRSLDRMTALHVAEHEDCMLGVQARLDIARGRPNDAIARMLASRHGGVPEGATESLDRFLLAELLLRAGREREAEGYLASMVQFGMGDLLLAAPSERRLGELAERRGDLAAARAHYSRVLRLWKDADPELRAYLAEVQRRLARLE